MRLNTFKPGNQTKDLLISIAKNAHTPIEQTTTKLQVTLEFKLTKPRETFPSDKSLELGDASSNHESKLISEITSLELYNSFFDRAEERNFKFYTPGYFKQEKVEIDNSKVVWIKKQLKIFCN